MQLKHLTILYLAVLFDSGINNFDVASIKEIETIRK